MQKIDSPSLGTAKERYERGIAYVRTWDEISGEVNAKAGELSKQ